MAVNIEQIQQRMTSSDEEQRVEAIRLARELDLDLPLARLGEALGDASWRVRKEAVACFLKGAHRRWSASDAIALLHSQDNAGLRNAAMEVLIGLGSAAVADLKAELSTTDHDVRKFILDIMGEIGDEVCIGSLIDSLADPDINVRCAAVENLGKLQAREAIPALLEAMQTPDFSWRFTILEALAQIGEPIALERLAHFRDDRLLRKPLYDCLGSVGDRDAAALLVEGLADDMRKCREAAALALVRLAERFFEDVRNCLRRQQEGPLAGSVAGLLSSRDPSVQENAIRILGWIGNSAAAGRMLPLLGDETLGPRVFNALMDMGPEAVCDLVRQYLGEDPAMDVYLVYLAGEGQCRDLAGSLAERLASEDGQMRLVTARTLSKIGGVEVVEPLLRALGDECEEVREAAASGLAAIGRQSPGKILEKVAPLVEAARASARTSAVEILGQLGEPSCRPYLDMAFKDESPRVRQAAVRALASCGGEDLLAGLKLALTDEDAEVRALAAENLWRVDGHDAVESLGLALSDEDIWVRTHAVRSLTRIGGARAHGLVEHMVHDPVGLVAISALEALVALDPEAARGALLKALDHEDEEVVKTAIQGLSQLSPGTWALEVAQKVIHHPRWAVRLALVEFFGARMSDDLCGLFEQRLEIEGDALVRQALEKALDRCSMQGK
ncbi:HEAT repeat domain-containing protein [Geoalkalibacter halelectricus]|uniref:HEAT repeat domain-containing protein n=1 Tax=Geoalkalibacter halelectricus TaxID=2847045 RepID=UPI003D224119